MIASDTPLVLALAEAAETTYLVWLVAIPDEVDALLDTLFLPAVEALTPAQ